MPTTWNILRELGFDIDDEVMDDAAPGLSYHFGNFKLSALSCLNLRFADVVLMSGVMSTSRSLGHVQFEMPTEIESKEQCAAWIAWQLDQFDAQGKFIPANQAAWLEMGRNSRHTLPWEREQRLYELEMERYRARPHCSVDRKWLRLALNEMADQVESLQDEDNVRVSFSKGVLTFRLGDKSVVLSAKGDSWDHEYVIPVGNFRNHPKRLMSDPAAVGIWESKLEIDRHRYDGVIQSNETN